MRRLLICAVCFWLSCVAAIKVTSMADISGDGASHQIAASGSARMLVFVCPSTNVSAVRIGDSTISGSIGIACAPGGSLTFPVLTAPVLEPTYDLSTVYYLIQNGDKLSITRFN